MSQPDVHGIAVAFGRALRTRRKAQRISMAAAADAAGMSRLTWHRLERGETGVAWRFALAAATVLGLDMRWHVDDAHAADEHSSTPGTLGQWLPLSIRLDDFPGLRRVAWQVHEGADIVSPREAWELYERNARHLDPADLAPRERALMAALRKVYGGAHASI